VQTKALGGAGFLSLLSAQRCRPNHDSSGEDEGDLFIAIISSGTGDSTNQRIVVEVSQAYDHIPCVMGH
jgi:hypothetical protein